MKAIHTGCSPAVCIPCSSAGAASNVQIMIRSRCIRTVVTLRTRNEGQRCALCKLRAEEVHLNQLSLQLDHSLIRLGKNLIPYAKYSPTELLTLNALVRHARSPVGSVR